MNIYHKFKTTNASVGILIHSGAMACGYRLGLGYVDPHAKHPAFISASLTKVHTDIVQTYRLCVSCRPLRLHFKGY